MNKSDMMLYMVGDALSKCTACNRLPCVLLACKRITFGLQVTAVQSATASAFLSEPAWSIAQTLTLQMRAGVRIHLPAGSSDEAVCSAVAQAAMIAKQQVCRRYWWCVALQAHLQGVPSLPEHAGIGLGAWAACIAPEG